jgi:DNA-directed RNA polymerase specialized sigma subunit
MCNHSWDSHSGDDLSVSNWKSLILELPKKELTDEELNTKLYEKLQQLSKEEKMILLKEMK